jgi:hypothetical protein
MHPGETLGALGLSAMAFFLVLSLVHDPLFHAEVSMAFALTFGLAVTARGHPLRGADYPAARGMD